MKSNDFVKKVVVENHLTRDHEVEMAKTQLYFAAKAAIELHGVMKHITEEEGLEGWVQAKITKASDYLQAVHNYLLYQEKTENTPPPDFDFNVAESMMKHVLEDAGGIGAGSFAIAIPSAGGSVNGFANGGPGTVSRNKKKKVREMAPPAANVAAPAGGTTTTAPTPGAAPAVPPKPGAPVPAGTTPPTPGQPPKPGAPAPAGAAPAPGQPAKPGAPAGTATPPNPAQVKKDQDALAAVLNNPAHPVSAELQALIKKAAAVPR
jgi:hypothetical protein